MKPKYFSAIILGTGIMISSAVLIGNALAQNIPNSASQAGAANIQYPVKELDNCQDEKACRAYCDKAENTAACLDFAQKNNLMSDEEINSAKKFLAGGKGPGNCTTKDSCEAYCNDISHIDECVAFAEKTGMLPQNDLVEAKKVKAAIDRGIKPPQCGNKKSCDAYCSSPDHMEECMTFAQAAGLMSDKEQQDAQKILNAIKKGIKPPQCGGKDQCDIYCNTPEHIDECMAFGEASGMMSDQEKEGAQKFISAIKKGIKPLPCKGKDQCDAYCTQEDHFNECLAFSEAAGFMSPQEAEIAKKSGGKGPGGCRSKEQCEAFCSNPDNQETCFTFGKENGLINQDDIKRMDEGKQKFQEMLSQTPSQVIECLKSSIGADQFDKIKSGTLMPSKNIGEAMRICFQKAMGDQEQSGPMIPMTNPTEGQAGKPGEPGTPGGMMKSGNIPPAVAECLKSSAGENIADQLKSGILERNPEIGDKIKNCFTKAGIEMNTPSAAPVGAFNKMNAQWNSFPPEVQKCLSEKLGAEKISLIKQGQGTDEDKKEVPQAIQECMQNIQNQMMPQNDGSPGNMPATPPQQMMPNIPQLQTSGTPMDVFKPIINGMNPQLPGNPLFPINSNSVPPIMPGPVISQPEINRQIPQQLQENRY